VGGRIEIPAAIEAERIVLRPLGDRDLDAYARAFAAEPALGVATGFETDPTLDTLRGKPERIAHAAPVTALAERLGFQREGLMRERNLERGRRLDVLWLAVIRRDWQWPLQAHQLSPPN